MKPRSDLPRGLLLRGKRGEWAQLTPRSCGGGMAAWEVAVWVPAAKRGQGLGRKILSKILRRADKEGLGRIEAHTSGSNAGARRILEISGFVEEDFVFWGEDCGINVIKMVWERPKKVVD